MNQTHARVALVTGASGGIGAAVLAELRRRSYVGVGVDVDESADICFDMSNGEGNAAAVAKVVQMHARLDVLVLCAGRQSLAPLAGTSDEQWEELIALMASGPFYAMRRAWPHLAAQEHARIVVVASTSSYRGDRFKAAYVAAKHALLGLVRVAALEAARVGMTVNAVAPGWVQTSLMMNQLAQLAELEGTDPQALLDRLKLESPAGRFVEVGEVAATIAFLASPESSGVNGACIPVDLGLTAG